MNRRRTPTDGRTEEVSTRPPIISLIFLDFLSMVKARAIFQNLFRAFTASQPLVYVYSTDTATPPAQQHYADQMTS